MSLLHLGWEWLRRRLILASAAGGIALGVGVLFTVLAVFQGFVAELESSIKKTSGDVTLEILRGTRTGQEEFTRALAGMPEVASWDVRLNWFGLVGRRGARAVDDPRATDQSGLLLVGVEGGEAGALPARAPATPAETPAPLLMSKALAAEFGLALGDIVEVTTFRTAERRTVLTRKSFELAGTAQSGRFDLDLDRAIAHRADVAALAGTAPDFSEIAVHARPGVEAEALAAQIELMLLAAGIPELDLPLFKTWRDQGGQLLRAAEDQKGMLGTVFFMIVLVAVYQLVATLLLTVAEKRREIGVLGALGAGPGRVVGFFTGLALLIATLGCAAGLLLGVTLVENLHAVERFLGGGEAIFLPEIYKFEDIPVRVEWGSTLLLVGATLACALVFSLLPAWRAARVPIVRALQQR
jgi:lipoprotein-releasing system permease protein